MLRTIAILLATAAVGPAWADDYWSLDESIERAELAAAELYADYPIIEPSPAPVAAPADVVGSDTAAQFGYETTVLNENPEELAGLFASLSERAASGAIRSITRDTRRPLHLEDLDALDAQMIAFIARHEAGKAHYDSVWYGNRVPLPKPRLTEMTLCEVMEWQARAKKVQRSTAVGLFQIVSGTMSSVVAELGMDCDQRFDEDLQNSLGLALLQRRGWDEFKRGAISVERFAFELAGEWAAFPAPYGENRGRSRYHGIAGNRHQVALKDYLAFLSSLRHDATQRIASSQ